LASAGTVEWRVTGTRPGLQNLGAIPMKVT